MALIDVVIPMYNSEPYIDSLIQTLEAQIFRDFCAVFVDDGSKDNTYQTLCQKLANVQFAHTVIHQENKGLPGARNAGIRGSQSPWIVFVDSDDGLDAHYLEFLYRAVAQTGCSVGACSYQIVETEQDVEVISDEQYAYTAVSSLEIVREYYKKWFGACALILNRQWLEQNELLFDEACTYLEDVPFITQVLVRADRTVLIHAPLYLYYQRSGSLMHSPKIEKYQIALDGFFRMEENLRGLDSESAREFFDMGRARYFLATLRKAAVLMPYNQFRELCRRVPLEKEKQQFGKLQTKHRLAANVYVISKRLFYYAIRMTTR